MSSDPTDQNVQHSSTGQDGLDAEAARFLASLQQRLAQAQSTSNELKNRESALAEQDRAIAARKAELQDAERQLAAAQQRLDEQAAAVNQREQALARAAAQQQERQTQIERAEAEINAQRERIIAQARETQQNIEAQAKVRAEEVTAAAQRKQSELDARIAELEARQSELDSGRAEVEQRRTQVEARQAEIAQQEKHAALRLQQVEEREHALNARKEELAREAAASAARAAEAENAAAALAKRESKLKQAERQLAEREKAAAGLAELAARRASEHSAAVAAVERDRTTLDHRGIELERAERAARTAAEELQTKQQSAVVLKTELDRREASILSREQQLRAAQEELERRRIFVSQCEAQAVQLEATSRHLREQAEQIKASSERQVAQWQDKATEAQFQLDSTQQQMQKLQEQLAAAQARARAMEEEMDQVKVLGINISPEAQGRVEGLTKRAETAEQRAATLQEIIDQHSDEVAKAEARFDALTRQLEEAQRTLGASGDAHTQQLAAWHEQNEQHAAQLAVAHAAAQQARADAERAAAELSDYRARAIQAEERAQSLARRVADAEQNAQQADEALRQACDHAAAAAADAARAEATASADAQVELLKSRSELAAEESERANRRVSELEAQIKKRDAEVAELRAKVSMAQAGAGEASGDGFSVEQRRRLEAELAQREEALSVLANRLLNSEERAVAMQAQLDRLADELADSQAKASSDAHDRTDSNGTVHHNPTVEVAVSDSRRRRLRRVRDLLAQEHRKVLLAKEALGRHKAEADAVLQQRARLSQMAQNIQAAEVEANKARAKSGAGSVIVAAMITLLVVGGISYLAAGVLWPSTYAARATLAAESDGRSPTEQQNRVWVAAHERLATDLQVYTLAAENFQQRGMRELATAAAVQDRFGNSLAVMTDVPGQITFELRGVGRENTARELETFVGAVSAIANSRRQMRQDGLGTAVVKQAEAGKEPLDTRRQTAVYTALGAGLAASFAAGFGAYTLLARVRKPQPGADPLEAFGHSPLARLTPDRQSNAAA